MTVDYRARLKRVYAAIHADPTREHSLDEMADLAALSRFHFHRVFAAMTGETLSEAVRRIRLAGAAHALVQGVAPVAEVGRAHGYPVAASFTRAFRAAYGMTPGQFRARGQGLPEALRRERGDAAMFPVTIRIEAPRRLVGLTHRGAYQEINRTYALLGAELAAQGLWPRAKGMAAVYLDDPRLVDEAALRSFAGMVVDGALTGAPPLECCEVAGGRHAVMEFRGPYTGLAAAYDWFFGTWLAESGQALREAPGFEIYVNTPMDVAPTDLRTDLYLPLEDANA